jgi:hypothetical protein
VSNASAAAAADVVAAVKCGAFALLKSRMSAGACWHSLHSVAHDQSQKFAVCFSALQLPTYYAASATSGKNISYLSLLTREEMPTRFFAARWPTAQSEIHPELLAECGGSVHNLWRACARLSGGHPRCACVVMDCLRPVQGGAPPVRSWSELLRRVSERVAREPGQAELPEANILRILSPWYQDGLTSVRVNAWVKMGLANVQGQFRHAVPLLKLLPFALTSHGVLAKRLRVLFSSLVKFDEQNPYKLYHSTLFDLLPLARRQEAREPLQDKTNWAAYPLLEGLCASYPWRSFTVRRKDALTETLKAKKYDFTVDRAVCEYQPGGLASKSADELNQHVWLPAGPHSAGCVALLFLREVSANWGNNKLTPIALEYDFSGELNFRTAISSVHPPLTMSLSLNTENSTDGSTSVGYVVAAKRAAFITRVPELGLADHVNWQELVYCLLAWRQVWDLEKVVVPVNTIVCDSEWLRGSLGPTLAHLLASLAPPL